MNKLKVILMIIGLIILIFLLAPRTEQKNTEEPLPDIEYEEAGDIPNRIRVVLKTNDGSGIHHNQVSLVPNCSYEVICGQESRLYEADKEFTVTMPISEDVLTEEKRLQVIPCSADAETTVLSLQRSQGTPKYRGAFELQCDQNGIVIINDLPLEEYLYAVVPSEMPSDYPIEALKAQAVCARTYAVKQMQHSKYTELGAHVDDSTSYQVYNYIGENAAVNAAVDATSGRVVTYHGEVKDTYYFSTSCGYTTDGGSWKADTEEDMEYLEARRLSEEAVEAWAVQNEADAVTEDEFETFIRSEHTEDYESNEPWYRWEMQIEHAALGRINEKIQERYQVNPNKILTKDTNGVYRSIEPPELGELQDISIAMRGDGGVIESLILFGSNATIQVITEYNVRYILAAEGASVKRHRGEDATCGVLLPSAFFVMDIEYTDDQVERMLLYGGGYGHGTGMSQNCAKNMALRGMQAEEIIRCFYQNVEIRDLSASML